MKTFLKKVPFINGQKWFYISLISVTVLSMYNLLISWQLQKIIDIAAGTDDTSLYFVAIISLLSFIIFIVFYYIYRFAHPKFLKEASYSYKSFVFSKILHNNNGIISKTGTGNIISRLTNDLNAIEDNYFDFYIIIIDIGISFIGAIVMMLWYSPTLTFVAIILSILPIIVSIPASKEITRTEKQLSNKNASFLEFMRDILSGYSVIKSFKAEVELGMRFNDENRKVENAKFLRRFAEENINLLSTGASVIMRLGVFLFGAWLSLSNSNITPGIVLVFLQLVTFVISPIEKIPSLLANHKAAIALIDKTMELIHENENNDKLYIQKNNFNSNIEIRNLSFSYHSSKQILKNISANFKLGEKYAIVGTSGSGKTTLLNLLMKSSDDYTGKILFDGIELKDISYDSLLNIVSVIHQNVFVFNDSIYNNITLYKEVSDTEFDFVVQRSGLSQLIDYHGKDFSCGANGMNLSGGEKQRISIARALLRNTPILLLDEATSSLDEKNTYGIMNSIFDMSDVTALVVTHRLDENILKKYDKIFVLNHGNIVETGTFDELIELKGLLYSLITVSKS